MTKDPFYLGLDLFLGQAPIMLFSLVGGVLADRIDRRKLLLASQYIQMTCAFMLTALFYHPRGSGVAHPDALVLRRMRAIHRRPGVFRVAALAGRSRGSAECRSR